MFIRYNIAPFCVTIYRPLAALVKTATQNEKKRESARLTLSFVGSSAIVL